MNIRTKLLALFSLAPLATTPAHALSHEATAVIIGATTGAIQQFVITKIITISAHKKDDKPRNSGAKINLVKIGTILGTIVGGIAGILHAQNITDFSELRNKAALDVFIALTIIPALWVKVFFPVS